jgi:ComEC/Rec2-related protein
MALIVACAAAVAGLAVTEMTRPPLALAPLLLAALLCATAVPLVWRLPGWRGLAMVVCALSLGAARGSMAAVPILPLGPAAPGANLVAALAPVREAARAGITRYLPEPQASLAAGVLLGGSGNLGPAFRADLQRSGLGHLVAVDGFKQVVVATTLGAVTRRIFGANLAVLPTLMAIGGYTLISGAHPSAVRAGLMVGLAQVAAVAGRLADPLTSLGVATLGMALVDPRVLLDIGLQLSVSATLGIVLLWPVLRRWRRWRRLPKLIGEPLGLTLAVTLGCLPIMLSTFQLISLVSPAAHVVAVPLLPLVLLSAGVLALASNLPPSVNLPLPFPPQAAPGQLLPPMPMSLPTSVPLAPLASVAAWLAWVPASLLAATIHVFGSLPGAAVSTGRLPPLGALALAGGLFGYGLWQSPEFAPPRRAWARWWTRRPTLLAHASMLGACLGALTLLNFMRPDGRASVTRLAAGDGDAVFVRGPNGRTALIVQGSANGRALADAVASQLAVWEHKLDQVVVMDPSAERAVGATLARYPTDQFTRAGPPFRLDLGAGQTLVVASSGGRLAVSVVAVSEARLTSGPTTFAARPGPAD